MSGSKGWVKTRNAGYEIDAANMEVDNAFEEIRRAKQEIITSEVRPYLKNIARWIHDHAVLIVNSEMDIEQQAIDLQKLASAIKGLL